MGILNFRVGKIKTDCYFIISDKYVGIIDPGGEGDFLIQKIQELGLKPVWVASTHGHFDHLLAASNLTSFYKIPFYLHPDDLPLAKKANEKILKYFDIKGFSLPEKILDMVEGTTLNIGSLSLQILETPGHSPGGVSFYSEDKKILFCGDLVFSKGVIGRYDLECSSFQQSAQSVKRVLSLPKDTVIYPGHGRSSTVGELADTLTGLGLIDQNGLLVKI